MKRLGLIFAAYILAVLMLLGVGAASASEITVDLPQGVKTLIERAYPTYQLEGVWGSGDEEQGTFAVSLSLRVEEWQEFILCLVEKSQSDSAYAFTIDGGSTLQIQSVPSEVEISENELAITVDIDYYDGTPITNRYVMHKDARGVWTLVSGTNTELLIYHVDGAEVRVQALTELTIKDGALEYVGIIEGEQRHYAPIPFGEAFEQHFLLSNFDGAFPLTPYAFDNSRMSKLIDTPLVAEDEELKQVDLQVDELILVVKLADGLEQIRLCTWDKAAKTYHVENCKPTAIDISFDTIHFYDWQLGLHQYTEIDGESYYCFNRTAKGKWRLSDIQGFGDISLGSNYAAEIYGEYWYKNGGYLYGEHPWQDILLMDFDALPTMADVLAQLDQSHYALVSNPTSDTCLNIRTEPDSDAPTLGKLSQTVLDFTVEDFLSLDSPFLADGETLLSWDLRGRGVELIIQTEDRRRVRRTYEWNRDEELYAVTSKQLESTPMGISYFNENVLGPIHAPLLEDGIGVLSWGRHEDEIILFVELENNQRQLRIYGLDADAQGYHVDKCKPLSSDFVVYMEALEHGGISLYREYGDGESYSFVKGKDGRWGLRSFDIDEFILLGINYIEGFKRPEFTFGVLYCSHPWMDIRSIDIASLPKTFDDVMAQVDMNCYAYVNNANQGEMLSLRTHPISDAQSLGILYSRAPLYILEIADDWARVAVGHAGGMQGYVQTESLAFGDEKSAVPSHIHALRMLTDVSTLAIYAAPSEDAPMLLEADRIDNQIIGEYGDEWYLVMTQDAVVGYAQQAHCYGFDQYQLQRDLIESEAMEEKTRVQRAEKEAARLPQGARELIQRSYPTSQIILVSGDGDEVSGAYAALLMRDDDYDEPYFFCIVEKEEQDSSYRLTIDEGTLDYCDEPLWLWLKDDEFEIACPWSQSTRWDVYRGRKDENGDWMIVGGMHMIDENIYETLTIEDGCLKYARLVWGNEIQVPYAPLPFGEGYKEKLKLEGFSTQGPGMRQEYFDSSAYLESREDFQALDSPLVEDGETLLQLDIQFEDLVLLVGLADGRRQIKIYTWDANGQEYQVKRSQPIAAQLYMNTDIQNEKEILLIWYSDERDDFCVLRKMANGQWGIVRMRRSNEYVELGYHYIISGDNDAALQEHRIYGIHPWSDFETIDFDHLPKSEEDALALLDTSDYAYVNNPNAGDLLNVRAEPDKDGRMLGKLYNGTPLYVKGIEGDWAHIAIAHPEGIDGYVQKEYLAFNESKNYVESAFPAIALNGVCSEYPIFTHPSEDAQLIGDASDGAFVVIGVYGDQWYMMMTDSSIVGYVRQDHYQSENR